MPTPPISAELAREAYEAIQRFPTKKEAAESLGIHPNTMVSRAQRHIQYEAQDPAIAESMEAVNTGMVPRLAWAKTKNPDGTSYSVLLKPEELPDDTLERIRTAFEGMKPAAPVVAPESVNSDLLTVYPLMDLHFGMRAWGKETGGPNYDTTQARSDIEYAFEKVLNLTPNSERAVIILGGDTLHADDTNAETPASKHKLDVDGRHFDVLDKAISALVYIITRVQERHQDVTVRVLRGNHDPHSHLVLTFALFERYRNCSRVTIEKDARDLFMTQWGEAAIFAHHGDKAKPERLTLYLSDVCPFWSATRHRYALTGHVHHDAAKDVGPLRWESLRAFCPPDSYAASMGYSARRALQALTFDKRDGLVLRAIDPIERPLPDTPT